MSGPYDQQQLLAQAAGLAAGQYGGQVVGFGATPVGAQVVGLGTVPVGAQVVGFGAGQPLGQTVTQTTTVHRSGERHRRQRAESSSSSGSERGYKLPGAQQVVTGAYQQVAAEGNYGYGGVVGGSYAAVGDSFGSVATGPRRQGRYQKQVIRLPDQGQGAVRQVRRRLLTPEPDTLERVYVQRAGNEVIEEITEVPTTPPPRVQERTVIEPSGPPQVIKRVVRVPPRSGSYVSNVGQYSGNLLSAGSYGNVQQASVSYQPYVSGGVSTGYSGYGSYGSGGYGSYGSGYGSYGSGYGSYGSGYGSYDSGYGSYGSGGYGGYSASASYGALPAANCFYV